MSATIMELSWGNHERMMGATFKSLFEEEALTDVTLYCKDGCLAAHKLILAACSPFFQRIFKENRDARSVVMVSAVNAEEMRLLLEFMYTGNVRMVQETHAKLSVLAEELGIDGFVSEASSGRKRSLLPVKEEFPDGEGAVKKKFACISDNTFFSNNHKTSQTPEAIDSERNEALAKTISEYPDISIKGVQKNQKCSPDPAVPESSSAEPKPEYNRDSNDDRDETQKDGSKIYSSNMVCKICAERFRTTKELSVHLHTHTKENKKPFACEFCPSSFNRSSHLARHKLTHTGERPYHCEQCEKSFSRLDKLKLHTKNIHESRTVENFDELMKKGSATDETARAKRGRGRPKKRANNYNLTNLPYGDLNYLTMTEDECSDLPSMLIMEPLVEISATNENSGNSNHHMDHDSIASTLKSEPN